LLVRHVNSMISLDVSTRAPDLHKRAAHSRFVEMIVPIAGTIQEGAVTATMQKICYCARIRLSLGIAIASKSFRIFGGDDGARTRDLCRDSSTFECNLLTLGASTASKGILNHPLLNESSHKSSLETHKAKVCVDLCSSRDETPSCRFDHPPFADAVRSMESDRSSILATPESHSA
jgi:hypothetical protein